MSSGCERVRFASAHISAAEVSRITLSGLTLYAFISEFNPVIGTLHARMSRQLFK